MRTLAVLVAAFVLFSGWQYLRRHQNEGRLALVVTELAQREVGVSCPGFFARLVEITPHSGWVNFDEHGRPADRTQLSATTCRNLERLWRSDDPPPFSCLLADTCPRSTFELVDGIVTLAHESWHLRGLVDEAQTQCYAVQSTERTSLPLHKTRWARGLRAPSSTTARAVSVEQAGFSYERSKGKNHCVMRRTVSPVEAP